MDALQVHAAAAAVTAADSSFKDVKVGFKAARGRSVRIFYGGEREVERMGPDDETLNSEMVAQAIVIRGQWPIPGTDPKEHRRLEGEMGAFIKSLRTRINGDKQLGGACTDLTLSLAVVEQAVIAGTQYAVVDCEALIEFDEYSIAP